MATHPIQAFHFKGEKLFPNSDIIELADKLKYRDAIVRRYRDAEKIRFYEEGGLPYEQAVLVNDIYRNPAPQEPPKSDLEKTKALFWEDNKLKAITGGIEQFKPFIIEGSRIWTNHTGYTLHQLTTYFEKHEHELKALQVLSLMHYPKLYSELDSDELDREMIELILRGIGHEQARKHLFWKEPTQREIILCNIYKANVGLEIEKRGNQWNAEKGAAWKKAYSNLKNGKPGASAKELETVIDLLQPWPVAQQEPKKALSHIEPDNPKTK